MWGYLWHVRGVLLKIIFVWFRGRVYLVNVVWVLELDFVVFVCCELEFLSIATNE